MSDPISATARNCTRCGKPLSRYNSGTHCQACVSAGRNNGCSRQAGNGSPLVDRVKLAQLRHDRGWTQEMLAGYAGLSLEMVRKLEQGMRTSARLSTLNALAQALDVQVGVLLPDNPVAEPAEGLARPANMKGNAIQASDHARPTLLRALITQRHWQRFGTFEAQFRRAARELAERESDPDVANLTVSSRQWERWYMGSVKTEPHPDACRVLEHMFGYPIQQLLAPAISADSDTLRRDVLKFGLLATASPEIVYRTLRDAAGIMRPDPSHAVTELCGMLMDYGFNPSRYGSALDGELPSTQDLERDVRFAFNAYQQGRFTAAASRVSALLTDAQFLARECKEAERSGVQTVLALSYQAAASILTKVGESDIALITAERGLNMAGAAGDPSVRASLIRCVAFTLHSTGRYESAMRLIESGAGYLSNETSGNDVISLSVHGTLFLVGSMAAARFGNSSKSADYLEEASRSARRLGKDANYLWTAFGPTNVAIHRVNTAVELGDIGSVLDSGLSLNTEAVPEERRVRYLLDVARAYSMAGNREDALRTMLMAERVAPEQVHRHYVSRGVVLTLMRTATGKPTIELGKLAKRMKISEPI